MARSLATTGTGTGTDDVQARLAALERTVEVHTLELAVQLQRIAQLQADIDTIRGAKVQLKALLSRRLRGGDTREAATRPQQGRPASGTGTR